MGGRCSNTTDLGNDYVALQHQQSRHSVNAPDRKKQQVVHIDSTTLWQDPECPTCSSCWHLQVYDFYLVAHEVFALVVLCIQPSGDECIHLLLVSWGNTVPDLWLAIVQVVQAVQFHVFGVPGHHTLAVDRQCSAWLQGMFVHMIQITNLLLQKHLTVHLKGIHVTVQSKGMYAALVVDNEGTLYREFGSYSTYREANWCNQP